MWIETECNIGLSKEVDELLFVDMIGVNGTVAKSLQRNGTVHGSGVDEDISDTGRYLTGKSALAAGGEAVNSDNDLFRVEGRFHERELECE